MKTGTQTVRAPGRKTSGVTLIESMMLMVIMSIISLGTGIALQSLVRVPEANNRYLAVSNLLIDKMEGLRALGFATLNTTASSSDAPVIDNVTYTRSWTITKNPGGSYDANFIQITVTIGNQSLTSAVCKQ
jgi:Tfp pilus assembly protein PilV